MVDGNARLGRGNVCLFLFLAVALVAVGQTAPDIEKPKDSLQHHFDSAQSYQSAGDLEHASAEYKAFLGEALHRFAARRAYLGDYSKAQAFFADAIDFAPDDSDLRLEYAETCRLARDFTKAQLLATKVVESSPSNARAHLMLGRVLSDANQNEAAKAEFEKAVALDSNYENGYALAGIYLKLKDNTHAKVVFSEMLAGFGDTPALHMDFGRAYARSGFAEDAIREFEKALAQDPKTPGAHYSLGAAYLVGLGDAAFERSEEEFHRELKINPSDVLTLQQLGDIELNQKKLDEAENHLTRAATLDPRSPDIQILLGQLYTDRNETSQAASSLRKAIALTMDASRNHFQVQRAHYMLGRILLQTGHPEEGQNELRVSDNLLKQSVAENQGKPTGRPAEGSAMEAVSWERSQPIDSGAQKEAEEFENRVQPAVADAYNNLGALAAGDGSVWTATDYFRKAAKWNPTLEGLDYNWGKAAFSAGEFGQAAGPLGRYLQTHPNDAWARAAMASSLFELKRYAEVVPVLQPIESQINSVPRLNYIYSASMARAGDFNRGMDRLKLLEKARPLMADVHAAIGELLRGHGDYAGAIDELRTSVKLDPKNGDAKYQLALALINSKAGPSRKDEALNILGGLAAAGSQNADVYRELGRLQLERGDVKAAIGSLQTGSKLKPEDASLHRDLEVAYRRASRTDDARRERELYEALQAQHPGPAETKPN
jgi:tetratricopeptide (TPR) repeat protein